MECGPGSETDQVEIQTHGGRAIPFFRGTDHLFGEAWSELSPPDHGPDLVISGDLHVENFGAFRTQAGHWRFDVNDFDEALVAPCGMDVVRCASRVLKSAVRYTDRTTSDFHQFQREYRNL